jgi:CAP12/Pycsar effector protein, TIR domain
MLNGRVAVFLSCSERFKERVARPIRDALAEHNVHGIIVADEPLLPGASGEPESKVDTYLDASDAFIALATGDDQLGDGTVQTRQNIIDEHGRGRSRPKLRQRIQVFKAPEVKLPSNINPTYERLDVADLSRVAELILRQLDAWDLLDVKPRPAPRPAPAPRATVADLIRNLELGDHAEATRRAYELLRTESRASALTTVGELRKFLHQTNRLS